MQELLNISQILVSLKNELLKSSPRRDICMSLLDKSLHKIDETIKSLDKNTIHWAQDAGQRLGCPEEIDGKLTKYGVAKRLGISVKTVENRQRDARRGKHQIFPLHVSETSDVPGVGGKPTHLWSVIDIEAYKTRMRQPTKSCSTDGQKISVRKKTNRRKTATEITEDGLLTIHGVARMLNLTSYQVQGRLDRARIDKSFLFPLPSESRRTHGKIPSNLWRREDVESYKEQIAK